MTWRRRNGRKKRIHSHSLISLPTAPVAGASGDCSLLHVLGTSHQPDTRGLCKPSTSQTSCPTELRRSKFLPSTSERYLLCYARIETFRDSDQHFSRTLLISPSLARWRN